MPKCDFLVISGTFKSHTTATIVGGLEFKISKTNFKALLDGRFEPDCEEVIKLSVKYMGVPIPGTYKFAIVKDVNGHAVIKSTDPSVQDATFSVTEKSAFEFKGIYILKSAKLNDTGDFKAKANLLG